MMSIFLAGDRIHLAQKLRRLLAHDNDAIGKPRNLFKHLTLIQVRITQHRVQRGHDRHLQLAQQGQDVAARDSAINAIFMLKADQIVAIEIEKLRGPLVGSQIFLFEFQAHLLRILVVRFGIVDRNCK